MILFCSQTQLIIEKRDRLIFFLKSDENTNLRWGCVNCAAKAFAILVPFVNVVVAVVVFQGCRSQHFQPGPVDLVGN